MKKRRRQWHLPFQNVLRITLEEDEGRYGLNPEEELTRKPLRVDFLILKTADAGKMKSSFGKLLRKHTILEYKGYGDYLSIDDFYKGLAYAYLYKSEGTVSSKSGTDEIHLDELALIFVCFSYPAKLMKYLRKRYSITELDRGIYQVGLEELEVIAIVQKRLEGDKYLWLKNLSACVAPKDFEQMAEQVYENPADLRRDELFQFIGENNEKLWKGESSMCKIFEEIEARGEKRGELRGEKIGEARGVKIGEARGEKRGREQGEQRGEDRFSGLMKILLKEKRYSEIEQVTYDRKALHEMYRRYGL